MKVASALSSLTWRVIYRSLCMLISTNSLHINVGINVVTHKLMLSFTENHVIMSAKDL